MNTIIVVLLAFFISPLLYQNYPYVPPAPTVTGSGPGGISATSLGAWYRSDSLTCTGGCTGTNVVTSLNDKSTNARNCVTTASPTFVASAVNTQPGVLFTAASSQFCTMSSAVAWSGNTTVFAVLSCTSSGGSYKAILGQTSGANAFNYYTCGTQENQIQQSGVGVLATGTTAADTSYHQIGVTYNNSAYAFYIGSGTDGSGTATGTVSASSNQIGSAGGGDFAPYTLVEFFVYTRTLTGPEITSVQSYLHGRYGT